MGRKNALASLTGSGEGRKGGASEVARDIDWMKVRRVQHGLSRPDAAPVGSVGCDQMATEAKSRRAMGYAYALAFVAGVLLGMMLLQGLAQDLWLLAASLCFASAGVLMAGRAIN